MEKFPIKVWRTTNMVDFPTSKIGNDGENLQKEIVFKFVDNFVDGQGRLEFKIGQRKNYIVLEKRNQEYSTPVKNIITKEGRINMQLVIDEKGEFKLTKDEEYKEKTEYYRKNNNIYTLLIAGTDYQIGDTIVGKIYIYTDIPTFKSNEFNVYCDGSINAVDEVPPKGYEDWMTRGNAKLNLMDEALEEVDNLNITSQRVEDGVEISITDKEGQTTTEKVNDGVDGQDGYSPSATVTSIQNGARIDITDKDGTTTANVYNGDDYVITQQDYNAIATVVETDILPILNAKQNVTDNTLQTINKTVPSAINEVNNIAKGAGQAISKSNYQTMITDLNVLDDDVLNLGQSIYVVTLNVPDLWVSSIESTSIPYTYTTDSDFINELETNGYVQVGYYGLSMLETQKVDLTNYVQFTSYATQSVGGVAKMWTSLNSDDEIGLNISTE